MLIYNIKSITLFRLKNNYCYFYSSGLDAFLSNFLFTSLCARVDGKARDTTIAHKSPTDNNKNSTNE